ncbi:MAG: PD-(D/E)XK nuclease family protein [Mycobacteriales bacterium]
MTTQLGLEGMPSRLFSCTPSRLTTWLDCPRRYRMTYLDRPPPPKGPPWAHNSVGAAVHLALSRWWSEPVARRTTATARTLVDRAWSRDGFVDDAQADRFRGYAADMVERYVATLDPQDEPIGVERTVATRSSALAVSGRVDRIDQRGDELVVVDYKTGRSVLTTDDARGSLALALYALACARTLRRACTAVELHHLPTGRVARFDHTEDSLARHLSRAEAIGAEAVAAATALADGGDPELLFPARVSRGCAWCDYVRVCPAGRAAGAPKQPWDGLALEAD